MHAVVGGDGRLGSLSLGSLNRQGIKPGKGLKKKAGDVR